MRDPLSRIEKPPRRVTQSQSRSLPRLSERVTDIGGCAAWHGADKASSPLRSMMFRMSCLPSPRRDGQANVRTTATCASWPSGVGRLAVHIQKLKSLKVMAFLGALSIMGGFVAGHNWTHDTGAENAEMSEKAGRLCHLVGDRGTAKICCCFHTL